MPIINRQDAQEIDQYIDRFFRAPSSGQAPALRQLFVEKLDFDIATGNIKLPERPSVHLPENAERIASLQGLDVVYVALPGVTTRIRKAEAAVAAKAISDHLGDTLLVFANNDDGGNVTQLHFVSPTFAGIEPSLRRMVIERDLPRRTSVMQLSNIYWHWKDSGSISITTAIEKAFDVEAVTKQFFEEYRNVFDQFLDLIEGFDATEAHQEAKKLFVQTLLNRLMFIYFLSRKGWLKFKGNVDYLNNLHNDYQAQSKDKNFYNSRLKPLFFAGLNNEHSGDLIRNNPAVYALIGDVPFLNGGLFEETPTDKRPNILVPDAAIDLILRNVPNNYGLFNRFNFTVMESTPLDVEVAVDPEMLGKVFEELVTGRHESGSYYTPRPVVAFMCREALKGYLESQHTEASEEAIAAFVDHKDTSELTLSSAPKIGESLTRMKVVDPACGSGAYLLGMMQELVELMTALYSTQLSHKAQDLYKTKFEIIEANLYGSDIDQFAVNMAMLRLWLSLAIEYDGDVEGLPPLPNLDFKIVCGDSLLGPDPSPENYGDLFRHQVHQLAGQLADLKNRHMRATGQEKTNLADAIETTQQQLRDALAESAAPEGVVDWRVEFAEVFDHSGGFDIIIANPPYVRQEEIGDIKEALRTLYPESTTGRSDLFCYFYVRGVQLLAPRGVHIYVSSNAWLDSVYGASLIQWLIGRTTIETIYESEVERQFTTAGINTIITVIRNGISENPGSTARFVTFQEPFAPANFGSDLQCSASDTPKVRVNHRLHTDLIAEANIFAKQRESPKWGGRYLRAPEAYVQLYQALEKSGITLDSLVRGERYLNTGGADGFFILTDVEEHDSGTYQVRVTSKEGAEFNYPRFNIEKEFLRPGLKSTDSDYLVVGSPDCWVLSIPADTQIRGYQVEEYVRWGETAGFADRSVPRAQTPWWKPPLQAQSGAKLLWGRTHADSHRVYSNPAMLVSVRFFRLHPRELSLTEPIWALLNSTIYAFLKEVHGRRGLGFGGLETGLVDILPLPVPSISVSLAEALSEAIAPIANRPVGSLATEVKNRDRQALDELILKAIGLPTTFLEELYAGALDMLSKRSTRAETISQP